MCQSNHSQSVLLVVTLGEVPSWSLNLFREPESPSGPWREAELWWTGKASLALVNKHRLVSACYGTIPIRLH